jgi:DNA-binding FadR family transcriptional regulator
VLSPDAARALAAAITAVGALRHDPGTPNVIGELDQARAALRQLSSDDLMADVLDRVLAEVIACRLASQRHSPQLDAALRRALILARVEGETPTINVV